MVYTMKFKRKPNTAQHGGATLSGHSFSDEDVHREEGWFEHGVKEAIYKTELTAHCSFSGFSFNHCADELLIRLETCNQLRLRSHMMMTKCVSH